MLTSTAARPLDGGVRYTDAGLRREHVLGRLVESGYVSSARLAEELSVSEMTIRRDLRRLELDGQARRVAGGAALPARGGRPFEERTGEGHREKLAIARTAVGLLDGASSVALDAGTTVVEVAPLLPAGLTVVTHSVPVLAACAAREDLELIGLGGSYQAATRSFAGPATRAAIELLDVDVALLSAVAVSEGGLYCANPLDAETKQLLARHTRRVVLLVDHTKLARRAPLRFATLADVDAVVTDDGIPDEGLTWMRSVVDDVVVAPTDLRVPA